MSLPRKKFSRILPILLFALVAALFPASARAAVFVSVGIAPPALPVYVQPPCPRPGFLWTPGYWAYGPAGYYWVPGVWAAPPAVGMLWTPPYWGWGGGVYVFHPGYWGPHVGYYGGINYGFGYMGVGFVGGYWHGGGFFYNRAVMNVNTTVIHNTYINRTVVNRYTVNNVNHVAYSGGPGGINHPATPQERVAMNEQHVSPTAEQQQHIQSAARDPQQRFSVNHGQPAVMARNAINARSFNQQQRIGQGLRSGQLSSAQAARDLNRQQNIHNSVVADRRANGGRLTPQERQNIYRRQNNASRQIYRQRHDGPRR